MDQIVSLADADYRECIMGGGGHLNKDVDNHRIRVSGNEELDDAIVYEHEVYKVTGSIEAQARIDSYIMPCIVHEVFGKPYTGLQNDRKGAIRNRIPGYLWSEMTRRTDICDVPQYFTLPDLGVYIRGRMISLSSYVPTCVSSNLCDMESTLYNHHSSRTKNSTLAGQKRNRKQVSNPSNKSQAKTVLCNILAFSHSCCPSSAPRARQDAYEDMEMIQSTDHNVSLPDSCTSVGCLHGSIISLLLGSVIPLCKRASQCRRLHVTHPQVRSAVSCCTLMEYTIVVSLVQALLLGLYPRGRKTAIFDVRVKIMKRIRGLVTSEYTMHHRRMFLLSVLPILQLAFVEYAYNFIPDFMVCEADTLCMDNIISTSYSTTCDQFREKSVHTGDESWSTLSVMANNQMDKLIRNMRMGPQKSQVNKTSPGALNQSCIHPVAANQTRFTPDAIVPICSPPIPKKRRSSQNTSHGGGGGRKYVNPGDVVMTFSEQDTEVMTMFPPMMQSGHCSMEEDDLHRMYVYGSYPNSGIMSISKGIVTGPDRPLDPDLFNMHVCATDNLHLLYPSTKFSSKEIDQVHALHRRVRIVLLPECIGLEQQEALAQRYQDDYVRSTSARTMYVCTSCALSGKPVPLRPPMRYSLFNKRFTCLTCHRCQRNKGHHQQRRDKVIVTDACILICHCDTRLLTPCAGRTVGYFVHQYCVH